MAKSRRTGFISYAHDDAPLVERFVKLLTPRLQTQGAFKIELWSDEAIAPGEDWAREIERAMEGCDFGLALVTPNFLASMAVTETELPVLLARGRIIIPVALEALDFAGADLKGLAQRQVFRYRPSGTARWLAFDDCGGPNRKRFCDTLVSDIVSRLENGP